MLTSVRRSRKGCEAIARVIVAGGALSETTIGGSTRFHDDEKHSNRKYLTGNGVSAVQSAPGWFQLDNCAGPSLPLSSRCALSMAPSRFFFVQPSSCAQLDHKQPACIEQKPSRKSSRTSTSDSNAARTTWFWREIAQTPNALSLGRMLSGPVIAHWIVSNQWPLAVFGLAVSGATDWLDGYLAKKQGQQSVLGSYLDPLADKVLICCTVGALVYKEILPMWVAAPVVARDMFLVIGTLIHHSRQQRGVGFQLLDYIRKTKGQQSELVQPFFVSKINTVVQLSLVVSCMSHGWLGWPGNEEILILSQMTVGSTLLSWGAYIEAYRKGQKAIP